jgi:hypothetical protein
MPVEPFVHAPELIKHEARETINIGWRHTRGV